VNTKRASYSRYSAPMFELSEEVLGRRTVRIAKKENSEMNMKKNAGEKNYGPPQNTRLQQFRASSLWDS
jgi:hypothetical protein